MPRPLSDDDTARILEMFDAGEQCNAIARSLGVAGSTVSKARAHARRKPGNTGH